MTLAARCLRAPPHCGERPSGYDNAVTQGQVSDHPSKATRHQGRLRVDMTMCHVKKGKRRRHDQAWSAPHRNVYFFSVQRLHGFRQVV